MKSSIKTSFTHALAKNVVKEEKIHNTKGGGNYRELG